MEPWDDIDVVIEQELGKKVLERYQQRLASTKSEPQLSEAEHRKALTHVYSSSSMSTGSTSKGGRVRGKRGNVRNSNAIVSKAYNTVAGRPVRHIVNREQIISANLRFELNQFLTTSTSVNTFYSTFFALSNFLGFAEYSGLFDQYRFEMIEVWIEPVSTQSTVMANIGELFSAVDLDDAVLPTLLSTISDKQNSLVTNGMDGHYHRWRPHTALAAYSGTFTSFANSPSIWIDAGSPNVQHYGIKVGALPTSAQFSYNMQVRARLSFKQPGI